MNYIESQFNELGEIYDSYVSQTTHSDADRVAFINNAYNKINLISKIISMAANGIKIEDQISIPEEPKVEEKPNKVASSDMAALMGGVEPDNESDTQETLDEESVTNEQPAISDEVKEETAKFISQTEKLVNSIKERIVTDQNDSNKSEEEIAQADAEKARKAQEAEEFIDSYADCDIEEIFIEEFMSWGVSPTYAGCKNIIKLIDLCENNHEINRNSDIETILYELSNECGITLTQLTKNLKFIISKADFSKSKFIPILSKINVTVEILLKEFIDFCAFEEETEE
jgi:hypothetical protein